MTEIGFERILGGVCAPEGFLASGVSCGIKEGGWLDLALVYSELPAAVAGVFTTNQLKAAPVILSEKLVKKGVARAVVVNSGNANAMTGKKGMEDAKKVVDAVEKALDLKSGQVLAASTGPIGEYLPVAKVLTGVELAAQELSPGGNSDAAKAIMTTDAYHKELAVEMEIRGKIVRMGAMAKGAGMIHPHMATMISVITTDMALEAKTMQGWLKDAVEWSFNRISIDGDQSTNDTVFMLANGAALPEGYKMNNEEAELFFEALCWLTANLAMSLVKDGEGATKLLRMVVNGAADDAEALAVARSIANSNLVKCMFFGGFPNWGRIAAAAGGAGVPLKAERLGISIGEHQVAREGNPVQCDRKRLEEILERDEVEITVDLGTGKGSAYFLTTDLSTDYVEINASDKT